MLLSAESRPGTITYRLTLFLSVLLKVIVCLVDVVDLTPPTAFLEHHPVVGAFDSSSKLLLTMVSVRTLILLDG